MSELVYTWIQHSRIFGSELTYILQCISGSGVGLILVRKSRPELWQLCKGNLSGITYPILYPSPQPIPGISLNQVGQFQGYILFSPGIYHIKISDKLLKHKPFIEKI